MKKYQNGLTKVYDPNATPDYSEINNIVDKYNKKRADTDAALSTASSVSSSLKKGLKLIKVKKFAPGTSVLNMNDYDTNTYSNVSDTPTSKGAWKGNSAKASTVTGVVSGVANLAGNILQSTANKESGEVDQGKITGAATLKGLAVGASTGAAIGSVIPGIGTVIGGAVGGIVGGASGAISGAISGAKQNREIRSANIIAREKAAKERTLGKYQGIDTSQNMKIMSKGSSKVKSYKYQNGTKLAKAKVSFADSVVSANKDKSFIKDYIDKKSNLKASGRILFKGSKDEDMIPALRSGDYVDLKKKENIIKFNKSYTKLEKGSSGIYINPANKGKFTATKKATGETTEELTHSKNPLTRKRAIFAQNAKKWHHANGTKDLTLNKLIKGHSKPYKTIESKESPKIEKDELKEFKKLKSIEKKYKKGVRLIETEGREPIFSKPDKNGKRSLIYYNPSAPTHKEGGVKAVVVKNKKVPGILNVPEGASIITANNGKNKLAMKAYTNKDHKTLNKIIGSMPSDNDYAQNGKKKVSRTPEYDKNSTKTIPKPLGSKPYKKDTTNITVGKQIPGRYHSKTISKITKNDNPSLKALNEKPKQNEKVNSLPVSKSPKSNNHRTYNSRTSIPKSKINQVNIPTWEKYNGDSDKIDEDTKSKSENTQESSNIENINNPKKLSKQSETGNVEIGSSKTDKKNSLGMTDELMPLLTGVRASAVNNIIQGASNPRKTTLEVPVVQLEQYMDRSDPNRKAAATLAKIKEANAVNLSAGNAENLRANSQQAEADKYTQLQDINNTEAERAVEVNNRNVERRNRNSENQTTIKNEEKVINQEDADANQSRLQVGLNELDEGTYRAVQDIRNEKAQKESNAEFDKVNNRILNNKDQEVANQKQNAINQKESIIDQHTSDYEKASKEDKEKNFKAYGDGRFVRKNSNLGTYKKGTNKIKQYKLKSK